MKTKDEAIAYVIDRLSAWYDGARIAAKQTDDSIAAGAYRNEMMNYAHLIDVLTDAK